MKTMSSWTFLTNHAHVLLCIAQDPDATLRQVADRVGITERATHRIVTDLEDQGAVIVEREGRRNSYRVNAKFPLRHPLEQSCNAGQLLQTLSPRLKLK